MLKILVKIIPLVMFVSMVFLVHLYITSSVDTGKYEIRSDNNSVYLTDKYEIDSVTNCINFCDTKKEKIKICGGYVIIEK